MELFALKRIAFVFVAGHWSWENLPNLPAAFEEQLELKGLDFSSIEALIMKATSKIEPMPPASLVQSIYHAFNGHPRYTLEAARQSYELLWAENLTEFTESILKKAIEKTQKAIESEERSVRGIPAG